jgi:hypothetical protein
MTSTWIHPSHQEAVDRLEARYAQHGLRFDSGFAGALPVQASGRIGRRFFYFRFRHDSASLSVGSPDHRRNASYAKRDRRRALRTLRRKGAPLDTFDRFLAQRSLTPDRGLSRHPSILVRYAVINDVTGEEYAGTLEQAQAEQLFVRLFDDLKPVQYRPPFRKLKALSRGSYTPPMETGKNVIRKRSER